MTRRCVRWFVLSSMAVMAAMPLAGAEEGSKTLPTLLIKGEIVSVDANDPTATLLKVKDRYGFETPIYLSQETKIARAEQALAVADLTQGLAVEVEYNFDINTAKRHAVNVKVTAGDVPSSATAAAPAAPPAPAAPMESAPLIAPEAVPAADAVPPESAPAAEPVAEPAAVAPEAPAPESAGEAPTQ